MYHVLSCYRISSKLAVYITQTTVFVSINIRLSYLYSNSDPHYIIVMSSVSTCTHNITYYYLDFRFVQFAGPIIYYFHVHFATKVLTVYVSVSVCFGVGCGDVCVRMCVYVCMCVYI